MPQIPGTLQLRRARSAASKRGLEASLLIDDWKQTCADQEYRCVYCEQVVGEDGTIEHIIPMANQGGTCITNCMLCCRSCNQAKGENSLEYFLGNNLQKQARIRTYLTLRQPGQAFQPFWTLPLPPRKKEEPMINKTETRITSHTLTSGIELYIHVNESQIVLQVRQPPSSPTDPLAAGLQVGTPLSLSECAALAETLLSCITAKMENPRVGAKGDGFQSLAQT